LKIVKIDSHQIAFETGFAPYHVVFALIVISCGVFLFQAGELPLWSRIVAVIFAFLFAAFLVSHRTRMLFDSKKQEVTISEGRLVLNLKSSIPFSAIKAIAFEKNKMGNDGFGRYVLKLQDREIPFSSNLHRINADMQKQVEKLISLIGCEELVIENSLNHANKFIQSIQAIQAFDFENIDPNVVDLIQKKRLIDAIKLVRSQTGLGLKDSKELVEEIRRRLENKKLKKLR
jgi:ribosomal protein L7/L12